jgi:hypothetical protein
MDNPIKTAFLDDVIESIDTPAPIRDDTPSDIAAEVSLYPERKISEYVSSKEL